MLKHLWKHLCRSHVARGALRSIGTAMLVGIGWKIGSDVYEGIKKKSGKPATAEEEE